MGLAQLGDRTRRKNKLSSFGSVGDRPWVLDMQEKGLAGGELGTYVGVLALGVRGKRRPQPGLFGCSTG